MLFLSHSHHDKPLVRLLWTDLVRQLVPVWIDEDQLEPGDSLGEAIRTALSQVDGVAVLLSPEAVRSTWVQEEIRIAHQRSIDAQGFLAVPVLLPGLNSEDVPSEFGDSLYLDMRDPGGYDSAVLALAQRVLAQARPATATGLRQLPVVAARRQRLADVGSSDRYGEWGIAYLVNRLDAPDPTERYWVYVVLAMVGGPMAREHVRAGLRDPDGFARQGAETGADILGL